MIKNNKWKVIISSLVILLPLFAGLILWDKIPHGFGSKPLTVLGLPIFFLALHLVCLFFTSLDKKQTNQSKKAFGMIFWILPLISLFTGGFVYGTAFGKDFNPLVFMPIMLGIMFVFIGNYLPKTKQNLTLGIRISWTLRNEENWNKTHRFAGKIWVAGGLILLFSVFLPDALIIPVSICVIIASVAAPILFSFCIYKKHQKEGVLYTSEPRSKAEKNVAAVAAIFTIIIFIWAGILMFTGNVNIYCNESSLKIEATYWSDIELDYSEIDKAHYHTDLDTGSRINGFGSGRLLLGSFRNNEFGTYTRYTYTGNNPCIVLEADGKILVIGTKDADETHRIYETILTKINK